MNEERRKECSEVSERYNILGHSAPVPSSMCEHVLLFARATVQILPASLLGHESARAHTCCLGQVRSGPVYYTAQRLPNTLFLHLLVLLYQRVKYVDLLLLHASNYIIRVTKSR